MMGDKNYAGISRCKLVKEYDLIRSKEKEIFEVIQSKNEPALIRDFPCGSCSKWDLSYLSSCLGEDKIVIHESDDTKLDFINKNFKYRTCLFSEFSKLLTDKEKSVYLRSTGHDPRSKKPARIENDFPALREDISHIPDYIPHDESNELYHSSVLRIASPKVQIWTHFDLYDNILYQNVGTKRIILFAPEDTQYLYVTGDKSRIIDLDDVESCHQEFPLVKRTNPYICTLKQGQAIYIPALWWHNIKTIGDSISIGFNIFWKDRSLHENSMYAEKDVYGNKNLPLFDMALTNIDKASHHIERLPEKFKHFYKVLLLNQLRVKLFPESKNIMIE